MVGRLASLVVVACLLVPSAARAQARAFVGGSFLIVSTSQPAPDPPGPGYLRPNFHGSLEWPAVGAGLTGGAFLTRAWEIRGEFALRRAASGSIAEDAQVGHFDFVHLSSTYSNSERLLSVFTGRHFRAGSNAEVLPLGGFTMSFATQALTGRQGAYSYPPNGTLAVDAPDVSLHTTNYGAGGGADVLVGTKSPVAFVAGMRLFWLHRPTAQSYYDRSVPPMGSFELQIAAGLTWHAAR